MPLSTCRFRRLVRPLKVSRHFSTIYIKQAIIPLLPHFLRIIQSYIAFFIWTFFTDHCIETIRYQQRNELDARWMECRVVSAICALVHRPIVKTYRG
ncbi:hypothetical protein TcasGA2_TC015797 [Tribolium castaneum]|uniref:Uncharacterized protein n=1 Tax=Tribolium castaneum TaxID=7070 RepID=D2A408_TRICA|nr:hypothetical protein TcasGA2_TC015797 [Tribolium castaneum]